MAERVERLTNLLALLLETPQPLSLVEIAGELTGQYPESQTARRAAFERDKAALREIGVPIEQEIVGGGEYAGQTRYWIDRERYELRDLDLAEDEAPSLPVLRDAAAGRTSVRFRYRDVERTVDPWGLLLRDGFWYLIGFDHGRSEQRTYRIDRIEGGVESIPGSTFERPAGYDPRAAFPEDPKLIGATGTVPEARVRIDRERAAAAVRDLAEDRVLWRGEDGAVEVEVPCANLPAFRSWLLGFVEHAEVLAPEDVRTHVVEWLEAVGR